MSQRILIADDEPKLRDMLVELLTEEGYEVSTAADGDETIEAIVIEDPDLLILDLKMPRMTGLDVLEAIRRSKPNLPIIVSSAFTRMQRDATILTSNVKAYLVKPVDIDDLLRTVRDTLAKAGS